MPGLRWCRWAPKGLGITYPLEGLRTSVDDGNYIDGYVWARDLDGAPMHSEIISRYGGWPLRVPNAGTTPVDVLITVDGEEDPVSCFEYELTVSNLAWPCGSDILEPNDSTATASPLVATTGLSTGYGDADWYSIELAPGEELTVDVTAIGNNVYPEVYDVDGNWLGFGDFGYTHEDVVPETVYVLVVDNWTTCLPYDLDFVVR